MANQSVITCISLSHMNKAILFSLNLKTCL